MRPTLSDQERIDSEAAHWLVELPDLEPDHPHREKFLAWLNSDPRHSDTYDQAARLYEDMSHLPPRSDEVPSRRRNALHPGGWTIAAAAACLALIVVAARPSLVQELAPGGGYGSDARQMQGHQRDLAARGNASDRMGGFANLEFVTPVSTQREITLPDGSIMTLGAASQIALRFTPAERRLILARGDAYFKVAHNRLRPFVVVANGTEIKAVGTAFGVHFGVGGVRVAVSEGRVEVQQQLAKSREVKTVGVLIAGQETVVDKPTATLAAPVRSLTIASSASLSQLSWREGWLGYDDRPLAEIVDDLNRYYAAGVVLTDQRVGALRVTGAFRTSDIVSFINALPETTAINVRHNASGTYYISPRI